MQLSGPANVLTINRMLDQSLDGDGDGLVHLIADNAPAQGAIRLGFRGHACPAFSLITILTRAILRRACRNRWGLVA